MFGAGIKKEGGRLVRQRVAWSLLPWTHSGAQAGMVQNNAKRPYLEKGEEEKLSNYRYVRFTSWVKVETVKQTTSKWLEVCSGRDD